ncbi:MAG: WecB/TagA/CpsF family glycosyltransferase [Oscillospiraceae bacterium]|jgi:N-acetylglucosaminyldiphosphoundecaprenol N-acetyl-beta-D-mannosaminyltransferase|nr:WecB/TagA/CpsF family glycosyltransferase [Oscillospiraceae bacterium]
MHSRKRRLSFSAFPGKDLVSIRIDVLGVGFDNLTMDEALGKAFAFMEGRNAAYAVTPNPEIVMLCREDRALLQAVNSASLVLADGIGVVKGAKLLGTPLKEKLPGIDFAERLFLPMAERKMSVFLLGAKPGIAGLAAEKLTARFPGLIIAGTSDGYFKEDAPVVAKINAASPDLLLVCLGAPRQELWMQKNAPRVRAGLMAGLGGAMDVFAGAADRAPERWRRLNLEWLYRLKAQPSRIERMAKLPKFGFAVLGKRFLGK